MVIDVDPVSCLHSKTTRSPNANSPPPPSVPPCLFRLPHLLGSLRDQLQFSGYCGVHCLRPLTSAIAVPQLLPCTPEGLHSRRIPWNVPWELCRAALADLTLAGPFSYSGLTGPPAVSPSAIEIQGGIWPLYVESRWSWWQLPIPVLLSLAHGVWIRMWAHEPSWTSQSPSLGFLKLDLKSGNPFLLEWRRWEDMSQGSRRGQALAPRRKLTCGRGEWSCHSGRSKDRMWGKYLDDIYFLIWVVSSNTISLSSYVSQCIFYLA